MTTTDGTLSGEDAAKIRVAAQEAVKLVPGATLGEGEIDAILSQTSSDRSSVADKQTRAASLATDTARNNAARPLNYLSATPQELSAKHGAWGHEPFMHRHAHNGAMLARDGSRGAESGGSPGGSTASGGAASNDVAFSAITQHTYPGTTFHAAGMSYGIFASLRAQGFNENNILHAAQDAKLNKFNVNDPKIAKAFSILDKDDGKRREQRNELLGKLDGDLENDPEFRRLAEERAKATTDADRARLDAALQRRGAEISKKSGYHDFAAGAPTRRSKKAGKLLEHEKIRNKANELIRDLGHDEKAKAGAPRAQSSAGPAKDADLAGLKAEKSPGGMGTQEISSIVDNVTRDPNNVKARRDYAELNKRYGSDPAKRATMAKLDALVRKYAKSNDAQVAANAGKEAHIASSENQRAAVKEEKHGAFAALLGKADAQAQHAADEPTKKDETKPSKTAAQETPKRMKVAGAARPTV